MDRGARLATVHGRGSKELDTTEQFHSLKDYLVNRPMLSKYLIYEGDTCYREK